MEFLITTAYHQLLGNEYYVVGEDIGTDSPIWRGTKIVYEDCLEENDHLMTLGEVLLDQDACTLIFSHVTQTHFEGIML